MANGIDYAIRIASRLMLRDLYDKKKQLEDDLALCDMYADLLLLLLFQSSPAGIDTGAARVSDCVGRMREELLAARNGVERLEDGESRERIAQAIFGDCALKYESCYRLAGKVVEALKEA